VRGHDGLTLLKLDFQHGHRGALYFGMHVPFLRFRGDRSANFRIYADMARTR
jgi:hypothetical protein